MIENAIEVHNVFKRYFLNSRPPLIKLVKGAFGSNGSNQGEFYALSEISLAVEKGEWLGVIGHNGAGKTTLLKLIAGLLQPDKGNVTLNGSITYLSSYGVGMVDELTVVENVFLNGAIYGISRDIIEDNLDEILEWAELKDFAKTKFKHLSSGMRSRLAFSTTRYVDADIYLLDEALSAGDNRFHEKCREIFEGNRASGKSFMIAAHSFEFIEKFCDKTLWLNKGGINAFGETKKILEQYKEIYQKK